MRGLNHALRGSTLVETLVMMLVAGIVFLTVMDGLTMFTRLQTTKAGELLAAGRQRDGYFRIIMLLAAADSVQTGSGGLEIYRSGKPALLELRDSVLIYRKETFRDTLLTGITGVWQERYPGQSDTVMIRFGNGYTAKLPLISSAQNYRARLDEIENSYGYEK